MFLAFYIDSSNVQYGQEQKTDLFFITPDRSRSEKIILIPKDKESVWSNWVKSICPDRNGKLWISLGNVMRIYCLLQFAIIFLQKRIDTITIQSIQTSLPIKDEIRNLGCDTHNRIYCASRKGMVTWIADSISPSFRPYTTKDGTCNDTLSMKLPLK